MMAVKSNVGRCGVLYGGPTRDDAAKATSAVPRQVYGDLLPHRPNLVESSENGNASGNSTSEGVPGEHKRHRILSEWKVTLENYI